MAPKIYMYTLLLLKISTTSCFLKLLPTQYQARQHNMLEHFTQNSDSAQKILQEALYCHNLLETANICLHVKNPAYFHFYLIAAIVAFISAAIGFRVFHTRKLDLKPQISPDISSKWNSMHRNIVHKLFIIMIDLTQSHTCTQMYTQEHGYTPVYAFLQRKPPDFDQVY